MLPLINRIPVVAPEIHQVRAVGLSAHANAVDDDVVEQRLPRRAGLYEVGGAFDQFVVEPRGTIHGLIVDGGAPFCASNAISRADGSARPFGGVGGGRGGEGKGSLI